jgi:hypothetical protein
MHSEDISWVLFWIGIGASIIINLSTGVLISIVFITLQIRRDLQAKLDEIWLLAHRAFNDITVSRAHGELRGDGGRASYGRLADLWTLSQRTLRFALTEAQYDNFFNATHALSQLSDLHTGMEYDRYWKQHEIKSIDPAGNEFIQMVDFGQWAQNAGLAEELSAYQEFLGRQAAISREIAYLLFYNPAKFEADADLDAAPALPAELEQVWNFTYLFPRAWKYFASELFGSISQAYRKNNRDWNERNER